MTSFDLFYIELYCINCQLILDIVCIVLYIISVDRNKQRLASTEAEEDNNMVDTTEQVKTKALRLYLESLTNDREPLAERIQEAQDLIDNDNYLVLTDEEADEAAKEYILDSVWAFNYSFLCAHSEAISEIPEKEYTEMAGKLCESFNKAVLAMIPDKDHFVKDAIMADGRGHFLSPYDGEENEIKVNGTWYFIYRIN